MRLPVIKHLVSFIERNDEDYVVEAMEVLEDLVEAPGIKDEELDVIGELLSNFSGALEVHQAIKAGKSQRDALNEFMKRVTGSIDKWCFLQKPSKRKFFDSYNFENTTRRFRHEKEITKDKQTQARVWNLKTAYSKERAVFLWLYRK